jgi:hypothetical protein
MPEVIAYGEDALTYWALTTNLQEVLQQLNDHSPSEKVLVIYRPSFGRRGASNKKGAKPSAQFGEFDAIAATPLGIYLIESKWDGSSELRRGVLTLKPKQYDRHRIMRWYLLTWFEARPPTWQSFVSCYSSEFEAEFPGVRMAPKGRKLALNLEFLLNKLYGYGHNIQDVLLYMTVANGVFPRTVDPGEFTVVCLRYNVLGSSAYFSLADNVHS